MLTQLLDHGLKYAPEFDGGLSNHLPMALVALDRLGASPDRLTGFAVEYEQRLELLAEPGLRDSGPLDDAWVHDLSTYAAYPRLQGHFLASLKSVGRERVLRSALPQLLPGLAAASFHGLIRTAYAIESGHLPELAAGLAFWACRYAPLVATLPPDGDESASKWLADLASQPLPSGSDEGLILDRMRAVAAAPAFGRAVGRLKMGPDVVAQLASIAVDRYLASNDFTVLHLMTSLHALRVLLAYVDDPVAAIRWYAPAFAAGIVASGVGLESSAVQRLPRPWSDICAEAVRSDDDHLIKLVYTCRIEAAHYGTDCYQQAATFAVQEGGWA